MYVFDLATGAAREIVRLPHKFAPVGPKNILRGSVEKGSAELKAYDVCVVDEEDAEG